jgi:hypothetical protein
MDSVTGAPLASTPQKKPDLTSLRSLPDTLMVYCCQYGGYWPPLTSTGRLPAAAAPCSFRTQQ